MKTIPEIPEKITVLTRMAECLGDLRKQCNQVLTSMRGMEQEFSGVNWGDLSCVCAEVYLDDGNNVGYRVKVEEVDPTEHEFAIAVTRELETRGFMDVYVETSW